MQRSISRSEVVRGLVSDIDVDLRCRLTWWLTLTSRSTISTLMSGFWMSGRVEWDVVGDPEEDTSEDEISFVEKNLDIRRKVSRALGGVGGGEECGL